MIGTCIDCLANCPAAGFYRLRTWKCINYVTAEMLPKKTNADRVREMSDEELADWLEIVNSTSCAFVMRRNPCHGIGCPCWLSWLKEEVKE